MALDVLVAVLIVFSLMAYALLGGADYGGGAWDLLATGRRSARQRDLIAHAIGPIWEANHVWLILAVVLLFSAFPPVFARLSIALHIPVTLMLIGIVLRGSAFTFRSYAEEETARVRFGRVFAIASLVTPLVLGTILGAVTAGLDPAHLRSGRDYLIGWITPFNLSVGVFALVAFAYLAAVYLTVEAHGDAELEQDFRLRALASGVSLGPVALAVFLLSDAANPEFRQRLAGSAWSWPLQAVTAILSISALYALWTRRFLFARVAAAGQVAMILAGWALAQYPWMVRPDLNIRNSAAPAVTLRLLVSALAAGAVLLIPSLIYLFRIFKVRKSSASS